MSKRRINLLNISTRYTKNNRKYVLYANRTYIFKSLKYVTEIIRADYGETK